MILAVCTIKNPIMCRSYRYLTCRSQVKQVQVIANLDMISTTIHVQLPDPPSSAQPQTDIIAWGFVGV